MARLRSQFRDAAKQRYKHCSTGQEGLADVIESLLEISLRIHENLVSKIRSCNVAAMLFICWLFADFRIQFALPCVLAYVRGDKGFWCLA